MPALKHLKIGPRLMLGFGLLALMMIFGTCLSRNRLGTFNATVRDLTDDKWPKTESIAALQNARNAAETAS